MTSLHAQFEPKAKEKNLSFNLSYELDDEKSAIQTDQTKLIQILSNLINNAIKFTKEGHVRFGCALKGNVLEFFVEDTGIGIPAEMYETIFQRFRQAEDTSSEFYGGTGLGLSISKGYVELLGGKIWLSSQPDKGSVFYFSIPYLQYKEN